MTDTFKCEASGRKFEALLPPGSERFVVMMRNMNLGIVLHYCGRPLETYKQWPTDPCICCGFEGFAHIMRDLWASVIYSGCKGTPANEQCRIWTRIIDALGADRGEGGE